MQQLYILYKLYDNIYLYLKIVQTVGI